MDDKEITEILKRYQAGSCSEEEKAWVESWYLSLGDDTDDGELPEEEMLAFKQGIWKGITSQRPAISPKRRLAGLYYKTVAAAAVLITIGAAFYFLNHRDVQTMDIAQAVDEEDVVLPGGNKAYLTLADGRKINLSDKEDGMLLDQEGMKIVKKPNGELVYEISETAYLDETLTGNNTIETPIGGQYQVVLPDGTRVWLNSSSSLVYPVKFSASERKVILRGEGYFEVETDKNKPFRVVSENQTIEVLGTKFNINTYKDETAVRTTLIEGSVKVSLGNNISRILKPGEQASTVGQHIEVQRVDTEQAVAWYDGDFAFDGVELKNIMRQVCRWYGVEVVYLQDVGDMKFGGSISRSKDIEEVLKVLSMTKGVNFKLVGRRVMVMR